MLKIQDLAASVEGTPILHGLSLGLRAGKIAALMGPNGSGKSTLANVLAGHPAYAVTAGSARLGEAELLELDPEERARHGLFLGFQYPPAIPGVSVSHFLRIALNSLRQARGEEPLGIAPFLRQARGHMQALGMPNSFLERSVNDGFSGGEKKRLEMLQMLVLEPRLVILDEIDSGLDIDAIKVVAEAVKRLDREKTAVLLITHYQRLLDHIPPDSVHVMKDGRIVRSGGPELAKELERSGYKEEA